MFQLLAGEFCSSMGKHFVPVDLVQDDSVRFPCKSSRNGEDVISEATRLHDGL